MFEGAGDIDSDEDIPVLTRVVRRDPAEPGQTDAQAMREIAERIAMASDETIEAITREVLARVEPVLREQVARQLAERLPALIERIVSDAPD
jgi:hypothetical protein